MEGRRKDYSGRPRVLKCVQNARVSCGRRCDLRVMKCKINEYTA